MPGFDSVERTHLIHNGKAKQVFATTDPGLVWIHYKDEATAFDGAKKAVIRDKGEVNARISAHLMGLMEEAGVPTHTAAILGPRDHLYTRVEIIPIEVVVRNICAGSMAKRYGLEEGIVLKQPLIELFLKSDALHDPLIHDDLALEMGWARAWELAYLRYAAGLVNDRLRTFWGDLGVTLVDFKLEFGRADGNRLLLADEISPDGSRLWEKGTNRKLDKDVFRRDLGDLGDTYRELFGRIFGHGLDAASPAGG